MSSPAEQGIAAAKRDHEAFNLLDDIEREVKSALCPHCNTQRDKVETLVILADLGGLELEIYELKWNDARFLLTSRPSTMDVLNVWPAMLEFHRRLEFHAERIEGLSA